MFIWINRRLNRCSFGLICIHEIAPVIALRRVRGEGKTMAGASANDLHSRIRRRLGSLLTNAGPVPESRSCWIVRLHG